MKLYVPDIGDRLKLIEDWSFELHYEYRNQTMFASLKKDFNNQPISVTIPKGSILKVDRIYIRKGSGYENFSSITFRFESEGFKKARFWAKLKDCNNIQFELESLSKRLEEIKLPSPSLFEKPKQLKISDLSNKDILILEEKINKESFIKSFDIKDTSKNKFSKKLRLDVHETVKKITDKSVKDILFGRHTSMYLIDLAFRYKLYDVEKNELLCDVGSAASAIKNAKTYLTILRDDPSNVKKETFKDLFEL